MAKIQHVDGTHEEFWGVLLLLCWSTGLWWRHWNHVFFFGCWGFESSPQSLPFSGTVYQVPSQKVNGTFRSHLLLYSFIRSYSSVNQTPFVSLFSWIFPCSGTEESDSCFWMSWKPWMLTWWHYRRGKSLKYCEIRVILMKLPLSKTDNGKFTIWRGISYWK